MVIWYDWMSEGWVDDDDPNFFVGMTPEGGVNPEEYKTREDFYNDGFEYVQNNIEKYVRS
jgi:hypothetical protein